MSQNLNTHWYIRDTIGFLTVTEFEDIIKAQLAIEHSVDQNEIRALVFVLDAGDSFAASEKIKNDVFAWLGAFPLPTVAFIDHPCREARLELALMCDIRLGGADLSVQYLKSASPETGAFDFEERCKLLLGREGHPEYLPIFEKGFTVQESLDLRLINQVIPNGEFIDGILAYLEKILGNKELYMIKSMMRCFNHYKSIPFCYDHELLLEQESAQFCYLVHQDRMRNTLQINGEEHED